MSNHKIVVVDDDPEINDLEYHLSDYQLIFEKNSGNAVKTICREKPDLVLLDLTMPNMNGFEVAKEIRCNTHASHTPVIFATFNNDPAEELRAYQEFGARDWVIKPFFFETLRLSVKRQLELATFDLSNEGPILAIGCGKEKFVKNLGYPVISCEADHNSVKRAIDENIPRLAFIYCEISQDIIDLLKKVGNLLVVAVLRPLQLGSLEHKTKTIMEQIAHTTIKSNMQANIVNAKIMSLIGNRTL